jgi:hypothetical protein
MGWEKRSCPASAWEPHKEGQQRVELRQSFFSQVKKERKRRKGVTRGLHKPMVTFIL